jgi:hypothetical protein
VVKKVVYVNERRGYGHHRGWQHHHRHHHH